MGKLQNNHQDKVITANSFFSNLSKKFSLGIINFNYDNVMLNCTNNLYTGFNKKTNEFEPKRILFDNKFNFLYHLHGSVHFDLKGNKNNLHEIYWNSDLESSFKQNSFGRNKINSMENLRTLNSAFIAGYGKSTQMQRYPFRVYYSVLDKLIQQADSYLFIGYGFKDAHLNSAFYNIRKTTKPVVVITHSKDDTGPMSWRHDEWFLNLMSTIPTSANKMGTDNSAFRTKIRNLIPDFLEVSKKPLFPLTIWHHGFINACSNYKKILSYLL